MRIREGLKNSFLAGAVLVTPLVVTLIALRILANWIFGLLTPIAEGTRLARYTANDPLLAKIAVAILIVAFVTGVGFLAQWSVGRRIFGRTGRVVDFLPVVRTVYSSVRQVITSVTRRESRYEQVVFVELPREGVYSIGLVTGESPPAADELADEPVYNVFLPGSPNPTQGGLALVPESQVHETDLSVRQGIHLLMTTGAAESDGEVEGAAPSTTGVGAESGTDWG